MGFSRQEYWSGLPFPYPGDLPNPGIEPGSPALEADALTSMLSKSLIQFSVDGEGCVPSLLFDSRPNYGGGNEDDGGLLQKVPCRHCCTQCPLASSRPPPTHMSAGDSWTFTGKSGSVSCWSLLLPPGCWCAQGSVCAFQASLFPVLCKFWQLYGGVNGNLLQEGLCYIQVYCTQSSCLCSSPLMTHICRRHSNPFLAQPLWGFKVCVSPPTVSGGYGV